MQLRDRSSRVQQLGDDPVDVHEEGADVAAISDGYISVTPVQLDLTDYDLVKRFPGQQFPGV